MYNKSQRESHKSKCSTRARERIIQVNIQQEPERVKQVNVQEPERESHKNKFSARAGGERESCK
jgi:hypothetical protein